ncbi:hypothetical protein [uncultured Selenomonas sp.]|uniref:hypothetical protein n=1 Tax=uncultured Selenomonas sp. TaxID=159275 RepID=UPI0025D0CABD|nr:hypothetical protein [uncultured Selenomonas sp.]
MFRYDKHTEVVRFGAAIVPKCYRENGRIVTFTCAITLDVAQAADDYGTMGADDTLPVPLGETEGTCASSSPTSSNLPIISKRAMSTGRANPRSIRARGGRGSSTPTLAAARPKCRARKSTHGMLRRCSWIRCDALLRGLEIARLQESQHMVDRPAGRGCHDVRTPAVFQQTQDRVLLLCLLHVVLNLVTHFIAYLIPHLFA